MAVEGLIAAAARRQMPVTWDALLGDERFGGEESLQATVDYIKERVFGTVITVSQESSYTTLVHQYAGKLIALELVTPGIDFWMNVSITETTMGPSEVTAYTDRARVLQENRKLWLEETRRMEPEIGGLITTLPVSRRSVPRSNTVADEFLTPSHQEFPRPYRRTARS